MSEILREIGNISRALSSVSNIEFKDTQLNKGQYLYLARIYENPGIINEMLADMVKVDRSVVSKAVKNLEQTGVVRKAADPENKKIRRLYVTEKDTELYDYLDREEKYSEQQALDKLTTTKKKELLRLLRRVSGNVGKEWDLVKRGNKRIY